MYLTKRDYDDYLIFLIFFLNESTSTTKQIGINRLWHKGLNIDKVMVEFDCQEVLTALDSIVPDLSEFGSTIGDCLPLENQFHDLSFHWTRRDANKATNSLARVALSYTTHVT